MTIGHVAHLEAGHALIYLTTARFKYLVAVTHLALANFLVFTSRVVGCAQAVPFDRVVVLTFRVAIEHFTVTPKTTFAALDVFD